METRQEPSWVDRLTKAARAGVMLDLAPELDDATLVASFTERWPPERCVPAEALRQVLLDANLDPDPRGLILRGAHIKGDLDLRYATLPCPFGLVMCFMPNQLDFSASRLPMLALNWSRCTSLSLDETQVDGDVFAPGLCVNGEVRGIGVNINGQLVLQNATLTNPSGIAIGLDGSEIRGGIYAAHLRAQGVVRVRKAHIANYFDLEHAKLTNPGGDALNLDGAQIDTALFAPGLVAQGQVLALGARIIGQLGLQNARLSNPDGVALGIDGIEVTGGILAEGLIAEGQIRASLARINGQFQMRNAKLKNPEGTALVMDSIKVDGGLFLGNLEAKGGVWAPKARIADYFELNNATVVNRAGISLNLEGINVDGNILALRLSTIGQVRLVAAQVIGQLAVQDATLKNPQDDALNLQGSSIDFLFIRGDTCIEGNFVLTGSRIKNFSIDPEIPERVSLGTLVVSGWELGDLHDWLRNDPEAVQDWLTPSSVDDFIPQPWYELAAVYDRIGQTTAARRIRYNATKHTVRRQPRKVRIFQFFYRWMVGYGYYPLRTVWWFAAAFVLAYALVIANTHSFFPSNPAAAQSAYTPAGGAGVEEGSAGGAGVEEGSAGGAGGEHASRASISGATRCEDFGGDYPCLRAWSYAAATVTPASALQNSAWVPSPSWLEGAMMALKFGGWILTAFLIAGLTGLLRKN